jgi:hypothetical protein
VLLLVTLGTVKVSVRTAEELAVGGAARPRGGRVLHLEAGVVPADGARRRGAAVHRHHGHVALRHVLAVPATVALAAERRTGRVVVERRLGQVERLVGVAAGAAQWDLGGEVVRLGARVRVELGAAHAVLGLVGPRHQRRVDVLLLLYVAARAQVARLGRACADGKLI